MFLTKKRMSGVNPSFVCSSLNFTGQKANAFSLGTPC